MIDESVMNLLNECAKNKATYLVYINNLDNMYDIEFTKTLHDIMRLQRDSLNMMMTLLSQRYDYLSTLTFTTRIYIEKYNGVNDTVNYYVFPQVTPDIPDGEKMAFVRIGQWFTDDKLALAFAEELKTKYGGEIVKTIV